MSQHYHTLWIKVRRLEVVLREVHVTGDCPQLQTEHLAAVLELLVGALTADLTGQLPCQDVGSCRQNFLTKNNTGGLAGHYQTIFSIELLKLPLLPPHHTPVRSFQIH